MQLARRGSSCKSNIDINHHNQKKSDINLMADMEKYPLHYSLIWYYSPFRGFLATRGCGLRVRWLLSTSSEGRDLTCFPHHRLQTALTATLNFCCLLQATIFVLSPHKKVGRMGLSLWWQSISPSEPKSNRYLQCQRDMHRCCISSSNPSVHLSRCHFCSSLTEEGSEAQGEKMSSRCRNPAQVFLTSISVFLATTLICHFLWVPKQGYLLSGEPALQTIQLESCQSQLFNSGSGGRREGFSCLLPPEFERALSDTCVSWQAGACI